MLRNAAFTADVPRPRRRERPWKQRAYLGCVADLPCVVTGGRTVVAHHLMHDTRPDRRRRDDRIVLPLDPLKHNELHGWGNEWNFFAKHGVFRPYSLADKLWQIYEKGWDRDEAIRAIVGARR